MNDKTTIQVDTDIRDRLDKLAVRKQPLNDVIKRLLDNTTYFGKFEENQVPENGRVRLTKAAGKLIEWRIKS